MPELRRALESLAMTASDEAQPNLSHRRTLLLAVLIVSAGLYGWIALRYPLLPGLELGRASWATLSGRTVGAGLLHALVYVVLVGLYVLAFRLVSPAAAPAHHPKGRSHAAVIWAGWLAMSLILLGAYPGESLDIFDYLFRGRMLAEYGASPLGLSPTPFSDRPFYRFITWRGQVDTYGPLWEYSSGGVAWAVGLLLPRPVAESTQALATYITGYRLLAIVVSGLCGVVIFSIARRRAPAWAAAALLAWLWNPLQLTASAVGAHNDVMMVLAIVVALWLFQRERWLLGLLALLLAAHVKLTALLLLPVAGLWLIRRTGWRAAVTVGLLALACILPLSWLLYAPLGGWATLPKMLAERTQFLALSPADLFYRALQEQAGWSERDARLLATRAATLLFCLLAGGLMVVLLDLRALFRRNPKGALCDDRALWSCGLAVVVAYLLVGSFWLMPWYGLWALPLAALLPASRWMRRVMPALTLGLLWSGLAADVFTFAQWGGLNPTDVSWATVVLLFATVGLGAGTVLVNASNRRLSAQPPLYKRREDCVVAWEERRLEGEGGDG
jgi:hypothetical protein